jgi:uncharacterized protein YPO0396
MGEFRRQYPVQTSELNDSVESTDGYRELHKRLVEDDLPRFTAQFKTYLKVSRIIDRFRGREGMTEASGRGSEESTRSALELLGRLGLQLPIVTPLQKIPVIEPYVSAIGFVDNPSSQSSRVHTLTIEEFHQLRAEHELTSQLAGAGH